MNIINTILGFRDFKDKKEILEYLKSISKTKSIEDFENVDSIKLFETSRQRTWLITTNMNLYCVLDDVEKPNLEVRWKMMKKEIVINNSLKLNLDINPNYKQNTGIINFGKNHKKWLYTKGNFTTKKALKNTIEKSIQDKMMIKPTANNG